MPPTLRNHALASTILASYLGIALSLETSSRFMQESRFNNPLSIWPPGPAFPTRPFGPTRPICPSGSA
eukprot:6006637-Pyramimonas_sp.AAC.1